MFIAAFMSLSIILPQPGQDQCLSAIESLSFTYPQRVWINSILVRFVCFHKPLLAQICMN